MLSAIFILLILLAFSWDYYAIERWHHRDNTVSGLIYRFDHAEPIISALMGMGAMWLFLTGHFIWGIIAVGLTVHLNWKA